MFSKVIKIILVSALIVVLINASIYCFNKIDMWAGASGIIITLLVALYAITKSVEHLTKNKKSK